MTSNCESLRIGHFLISFKGIAILIAARHNHHKPLQSFALSRH
jgi:hypothetical protein